MKGLLIKDFRLFASQGRAYIGILAIGLFMAIGTKNPAFALGYIALVIPMFASSSISYDEYDNGNAFLFTLPITRRGYVMEKYVFATLLGALSCILGTLIALGVSSIGDDPFGDILISAPIIFAFTVLMQSVMLPLQLKFGAEKSRVAILIFGASAIGLGYLVFKLSAAVGVDAKKIISLLEGLEPWMVIVAALALLLIVIFVSIKISISVMNKKEM